MKDIILFDLDGTLADCSHRLCFIVPPGEGIQDDVTFKKDWSGFFAACSEDAPILHNILILHALSAAGFKIFITSGRSDECREATERWLTGFDIDYERLIMRREGDHTDDGLLKPSWLKDGTIDPDRVLCAFDDRKRVVDAWRDAGIPCLQVANGDF